MATYYSMAEIAALAGRTGPRPGNAVGALLKRKGLTQVIAGRLVIEGKDKAKALTHIKKADESNGGSRESREVFHCEARDHVRRRSGEPALHDETNCPVQSGERQYPSVQENRYSV